VSDYSAKIMVVDDSKTMRRLQKNILVSIGFANVTEAEDGNVALRELEANTDFELILLDWNMPNLGGLETLKKIKAMPETKHIPVIMVTSEAEKAQVLVAVQAGVAGYVVKPFGQGPLEKQAKAVLGIK
jgi:two-component system, chemotaxis family, chemotaxis protein CheY